MPLTEPSPRRLTPVRLTDLPLDVRYRAAVLAAKQSHDPEEAKALLAAAINPSETVYYVAAAA